ncbi:putative terminase small subunit [Agrobacterium phage OLIVR2]|uniref:Putative terminase small subunit n=1 Tax=Agrobacterium phage OLIVR1 TaxID=2723769 RepID=A0A858MRA0_9CAUD|nr:hypothetical protein [Xanthomonas campestris]YP_010107141.1 putative terminase small subunit [Agrobacterium phage OLIVR1]QIW87409.1 putative terminase small subunit [Agrobacterium phage OLIVR2]QIW87516.1 putative terminase small subunit [Agrobacterium phage OLIVR3]MCF8861606.1 hypothetical protein [Xanthomonas campestris pv. campestris]QIW87302.1 putative terminase small subunit [Agrobacterium phage OLIVR1]
MSVPSAPFSSPIPVTDEDLLTLEEVKSAVPTTLRASITQDYVDKLNGITTDPIVRDHIQRNFVSYTAVLKEGKFKTDDYLAAVAFVSFKLMGYTDKDSYAKTFPDRYTALVANGTPEKTISSYVSIYKKGKLVNLILEQSLVPSWVLNQHMYQEALNVQFELMRSADSEKVRTEAANSLLTHLKKPEAAKGININLGEQDQQGMAALTQAITQLAQTQKTAIEMGTMKTIDVAASRLVHAEEIEE